MGEKWWKRYTVHMRFGNISDWYRKTQSIFALVACRDVKNV